MAIDVNSTVNLFTDGACPGNQYAKANGGYGFILVDREEGRRIEQSQGYLDTTNNRMELRGVIAGLSLLERERRVVVITDSKYVADAVRMGWLANWQRNGWKNSQGKPVANRDLWEALIPLLARHEVIFRWVPGHFGHQENERCDEMAVAAAWGESGPLVPDVAERLD